MADVIVSIVAEKAVAMIEVQIRNEINLVRGVEKELLKLVDELKTIRDVLDDAESRRFKDRSVNLWLSRLEDSCHEMEDVLDEWNHAIIKLLMEHDQSDDAIVAPSKRKVCSIIPSSCLYFRKFAVGRNLTKKIRNVKAKLDLMSAEIHRYDFVMSEPTTHTWRDVTTSVVDFDEVLGRDIDRDILVTKLMGNGANSREELGLQILSIVGMGGLGKTTLAQLVYNDSRVEKSFDLRIWVCVSDPFDLVAIAKGIIESAGKRSYPNSNELGMLLQCLRDSITGKKFLLVLDDVWTEDFSEWEPLRNSLKDGGVGSKILVTRRNEMVAKIMGTMENDIHRLRLHSDEDCWLLLSRVALSGRKKEKLEVIGRMIARKCKGMPFAAKTLGSVLRCKNTREEWKSVLDTEIWELEEAEVGLFPHLLLSYNELSPILKLCFSYCAIFPKDSVIEVEKLIGYWIALGYLGSSVGSGSDIELRGREYFDMLAMRSIFQDFKRSDLDGQIKICKMNGIVRDFAQFLRKRRNIENTWTKTTCQVCNRMLLSSVKVYRSLFCYDEPPSSICGCLTSLRVLEIRCKLRSIPRGVENLINLTWLDLSDSKLSREDAITICKLNNLQFLSFRAQEIPREIGNLIRLRHLDLSFNGSLRELPESICSLQELRTLNIKFCGGLSELPRGIHRLINLKHLLNSGTSSLKQNPAELAELTGLRTLHEYCGGIGRSKLGWLRNLNQLSGSLTLNVELDAKDLGDVVKDVREARMWGKMHIQELFVKFEDRVDERYMDGTTVVLYALEPHPNLQKLHIWFYKGSELPSWISSPLTQLMSIKLYSFNHLSSGELPCLEEIYMAEMRGLQSVGREFLGRRRRTGNRGIERIVFPKLKEMAFSDCPKWKVWEDITAEEEESTALSLMPCLKKLTVTGCPRLTALPHRILHKASSLEELNISYSNRLRQSYGDVDGFASKSISQNPRLVLRL